MGKIKNNSVDEYSMLRMKSIRVVPAPSVMKTPTIKQATRLAQKYNATVELQFDNGETICIRPDVLDELQIPKRGRYKNTLIGLDERIARLERIIVKHTRATLDENDCKRKDELETL